MRIAMGYGLIPRCCSIRREKCMTRRRRSRRGVGAVGRIEIRSMGKRFTCDIVNERAPKDEDLTVERRTPFSSVMQL